MTLAGVAASGVAVFGVAGSAGVAASGVAVFGVAGSAGVVAFLRGTAAFFGWATPVVSFGAEVSLRAAVRPRVVVSSGSVAFPGSDLFLGAVVVFLVVAVLFGMAVLPAVVGVASSSAGAPLAASLAAVAFRTGVFRAGVLRVARAPGAEPTAVTSVSVASERALRGATGSDSAAEGDAASVPLCS
ncbi:hypothetical protein ACH4T9_27720 [Micromonospora sp. NPDC020750]|uniref:hypothetical protein n=1 Tax=unclassified Micromonospora TaxID=2617518 RepID=UPI0037918B96